MAHRRTSFKHWAEAGLVVGMAILIAVLAAVWAEPLRVEGQSYSGPHGFPIQPHQPMSPPPPTGMPPQVPGNPPRNY